MKRLIHHLFRRHDWRQTGEFGTQYLGTERFPIERIACLCGARSWEMTLAAQRRGIA